MEEKIYMNWNLFDVACKDLARQIKECHYEFDGILTIPRGGFPVATKLAHLLEIDKIYTDIEEAEHNCLFILFVDDISDTGETILKNCPRHTDCKIATLYYKPTSKVKPDFYVLQTTKWVVFPWESK